MADNYQRIIDILSPLKRVLVTTHVKPDGDALGTAATMVLGMRKKGIDVEVLLFSDLPRKYAFVFEENRIIHHVTEKNWPAQLSLDRYQALLVVDTGTWSQLPGLEEKIRDWKVPKLVMDHHLTQQDWADVKLVVTEAPAAGEIAAELLSRWNVPIDAAMAAALFLAISSDTGWFQFSNTRPSTMRLAAALMEAGVDTDRMYQSLYQNELPERIKLQTRALESMELLCDNRLAVMSILRTDFEQTGAGMPDTENLINIPLQIEQVKVSIFLVEPTEPGPIRVSLRSKGQIDVAKFAEQFGGGGHARAAGLRIDKTLELAKSALIARLSDQLKY
jgi:bifunctional oligoribonuclease and PAP phosphatase NrnA